MKNAERDSVVEFSKKPGGRPEVTFDRDACIKAIRDGASVRAAAARGGISRSTLLRRLRDPKFADFALDAERAWADLEGNELEAMRTAKGAEWQKHAWRLERMRPLEWSLTKPRLDALATQEPDDDDVPGDVQAALDELIEQRVQDRLRELAATGEVLSAQRESH